MNLKIKIVKVSCMLIVTFMFFSSLKSTVEAKSMTWSTGNQSDILAYFANGGGIPNCITLGGLSSVPICFIWETWSLGLTNFNVNIHREVHAYKNGIEINDGDTIAVGDILTFSVPIQDSDITWNGTGGTMDTPIGHWGASAVAPNINTATDLVEDVIYPGNGRVLIYIPLVINPSTITVDHQGSTAGLDCNGDGSVDSNPIGLSCTVLSLGSVKSKVTYGPTSGKFYYKYTWYDTAGNTAPYWDYYTRVAMQKASSPCTFLVYSHYMCNYTAAERSDYRLQIPEHAISFNFNVASNNNPPNPPTITGPLSANLGSTQTFAFTGSDPDNDTVRYEIDWNNNGTVTGITPTVGFVPSNTEASSNRVLPGSGATYTFQARTEDSKGAVSSWATFTVALTTAVDGSCGAAHGLTLATAPVNPFLCTLGTASAVTGTGPWNWNCAGTNGGATVACMAQIIPPALDLTSTNLTVSNANPVVNTPIDLTASVNNIGGIDVSAFSDNFSYKWGSGSWTNLNPYSTHASLAQGVSALDTYTFTPNQTGDLYIQHCVDSSNNIDEGLNEIPNCSVAGPYTVANSGCPAQTINHCDLPATGYNATAGQCEVGYKGSCEYRCDTGATWDVTVGNFTNNCTPLDGTLTVITDSVPSDPDIDVPTGDPVQVSWDTNADTDCTITGLPSGETWSNLPADGGPRTTQAVTEDKLVSLVCDGKLLDSVPITEITPPNTVDITANRRIIDPLKDPEVILSWRTPISEELCTIAGPGIVGTPLRLTLDGDPNRGSITVDVPANTVYTLDCQGAKDTVRIEVIEKQEEQ